MFWLWGNRLQSYIRHLRWTLWWSVPAWNLRGRRAKQYKRQRESRKSYRRQTVWGVPGWPCGSINLVASGVGGTERFSGDGCSVGLECPGIGAANACCGGFKRFKRIQSVLKRAKIDPKHARNVPESAVQEGGICGRLGWWRGACRSCKPVPRQPASALVAVSPRRAVRHRP